MKKRLKQPRNKKGKFTSLKRKGLLIEDHLVSKQVHGICTLKQAREFMLQQGGSYIFQD